MVTWAQDARAARARCQWRHLARRARADNPGSCSSPRGWLVDKGAGAYRSPRWQSSSLEPEGPVARTFAVSACVVVSHVSCCSGDQTSVCKIQTSKTDLKTEDRWTFKAVMEGAAPKVPSFILVGYTFQGRCSIISSSPKLATSQL